MRGKYALVSSSYETPGSAATRTAKGSNSWWRREARVCVDELCLQVYFGFTHCPDICPEELDKMAQMIDLVKDSCGNVLRPIFITCDPARDTPAVTKEYLKEFHADLVGLTGTWEQVKAVCKAYRVYFSTPPDVKPGQDYLVDHSIYFYLMGGLFLFVCL